MGVMGVMASTAVHSHALFPVLGVGRPVAFHLSEPFLPQGPLSHAMSTPACMGAQLLACSDHNLVLVCVGL